MQGREHFRNTGDGDGEREVKVWESTTAPCPTCKRGVSNRRARLARQTRSAPQPTSRACKRGVSTDSAAERDPKVCPLAAMRRMVAGFMPHPCRVQPGVQRNAAGVSGFQRQPDRIQPGSQRAAAGVSGWQRGSVGFSGGPVDLRISPAPWPKFPVFARPRCKLAPSLKRTP
eukprot:gene12677-biopygen16953